MNNPPEFIVVCGFLGSGKTTLIEHYLGAADSHDTAVIVNDVGEINIDGAVLANAGDLKLARLANGCVCCSLGNELLTTIRQLIEERRLAGLPAFRRFILECSGISDPAPIVRSLGALSEQRFRVAIVCTYSCTERADTPDSFAEAASQLANATTVVLTKTDCVDAAMRGRVAGAAAMLAPMSTVLNCSDPLERAQRAFELPEVPGALPAFTAPRAQVHPRLAVYQLSSAGALDWSGVQDWLENLIGYFNERLLRIKGIIKVEGLESPLLIQSVGTHVSQPRPMRQAVSGSSVFLVVRDAVAGEMDDAAALPGRSQLRRLSGLFA